MFKQAILVLKYKTSGKNAAHIKTTREHKDRHWFLCKKSTMKMVAVYMSPGDSNGNEI